MQNASCAEAYNNNGGKRNTTVCTVEPSARFIDGMLTTMPRQTSDPITLYE